MKSTSTEEVSIHAVFAASSFGGSAASANGACRPRATSRNRTSEDRLRIIVIGPPPLRAPRAVPGGMRIMD
jgi:hypothetical protein